MKAFRNIALVAALVLGLSLPLFAQDEVNDNTVIRILQSTYPKLDAKQIEVELIKNLNNRVKVNLKLIDTSAILYLTWQRYRNQYRWWYERNERNSLVFLGKRPQELSKLATVSRPKPEPQMDKPTAQEEQAEKPRTEVIEFGKQKEEPKKEERAMEPKAEMPEPEPEKQIIKEKPAAQPEKMPAEEPAKQTEEKEATPPSEEPSAQPVKKEMEPAKAEAKEIKEVEAKKEVAPEAKSSESEVKKEQPKMPEPEAKPAAEEKPEAEEKPMEKAKPVEEAKPVEAEETTREELQAELNKLTPSAKKEEPAKPSMPSETPEKEPMKTEEAMPGEAQPEAEGEASPFLPVPIATGPAATPREFLSTLVMTIGKGEEDQYANFLFRPSEMAGEVQERDFQRAVDIWTSQFDVVHEQIKKAGHVSIRRVLLQRPQTPELERTTRASLQRQVKNVEQVYNFVKIDLAIDGQPAYITIGGLVQTGGGWRVAGRIELVKQITVQ